jgi:hypothetical protein
MLTQLPLTWFLQRSEYCLVNMALKSVTPMLIPSLESFADIGQALASVKQLRLSRLANIELAQRTSTLRIWQAARFRNTYTDVLSDPHMGPAASFFLSELYSGQEYSSRDAQFSRIAGAIERLFPQSVVLTATLLAQLHALSEALDTCMSLEWSRQCPDNPLLDLTTYQFIWKNMLVDRGYALARGQQLFATQQLGLQLQRHTQVPGLRLMLKMMRVPASAAGLQDLQRFLEHGFDTFGQLGNVGMLPQFLSTIEQRETLWLSQMAG